jgi:hypothetical protein
MFICTYKYLLYGEVGVLLEGQDIRINLSGDLFNSLSRFKEVCTLKKEFPSTPDFIYIYKYIHIYIFVEKSLITFKYTYTYIQT